MNDHSPSRRAFLQRTAWLSAAGAAAPFAMNLATMAEVAAQTSGAGDYKALVCVFMQGGNDHGNTLLPVDASSHAAYAKARSDLALPLSSLVGTTLATDASSNLGGRQVALAPALQPLKALYDGGRLAGLLNIGTLVEPTTLAQYKSQSVPLPPKLFSHNDQQAAWQSHGAEGTSAGWGGRVVDAALSNNGQASLTCINTSGNAVFVAGEQAVPFMVSPAGVPAVAALGGGMFGSAACEQAFLKLVTQTSQAHVLAAEHAKVMKRALDTNGRLRSALSGAPALNTVFDADGLSRQLAMVARLMSVRATLGMKRQVFFVQLGGFDLHDNFAARHPVLLGQVAQGLSRFQQALDEMGLAQQVTTFTASDFGRTLSSNGDGSDHGWGSHHFVMGGAVQGQRLFGTLPDAGLGGSQDVGQGRLLPTMAVQQLAAALGRWMGVGPSDLGLVAPGHSVFDATVLSGLMKT